MRAEIVVGVMTCIKSCKHNNLVNFLCLVLFLNLATESY